MCRGLQGYGKRDFVAIEVEHQSGTKPGRVESVESVKRAAEPFHIYP